MRLERNTDSEDIEMPKPIAEQIAEADDRGNRYLADANEAQENGKFAKADKLYAKGQFWLDRYNKLAGNL